MHTHLNEDSSDGSSDGRLYPQEQVYLNEESSDGSSGGRLYPQEQVYNGVHSARLTIRPSRAKEFCVF